MCAAGKRRTQALRWLLRNGKKFFASPVDQVTAFLVERSERATRLRQSSPFAGILTEAERRAVFESFRLVR